MFPGPILKDEMARRRFCRANPNMPLTDGRGAGRPAAANPDRLQDSNHAGAGDDLVGSDPRR
jgi:hypothetical protein